MTPLNRRALLPLLLTAFSLVACGDDDGDAIAGRDGGAGQGGGPGMRDGGAGPSDGGSGPSDEDGGEEACTPVGTREHPHDSDPAMHVTAPLPASSYNSSPPSSGPHCGQWGEWAIYDEDKPLPACNFIHNLEHGGVVLLYNCPSGCPDIVAALEQLVADAPDDPDCGAAKRLILTPYEEMDATVAAAAWGYTWTSDCFDDAARADLLEFITDHWGSRGDSPEATICGGGQIGP